MGVLFVKRLFFCYSVFHSAINLTEQQDSTLIKKRQLMQTSHNQILRVAVPLAVPELLDYTCSSDENIPLGSFVSVQVGNKHVSAIVFDKPQKSAFNKLKEAKLLNIPPLPSETLAFYKWAYKYTLGLPGDVVRASFVKGDIPENPAPLQQLVWHGELPEKLTLTRSKVIESLKHKNTWPTISNLARTSDVSDAVVRTLVKQQILHWETVAEKTPEIKGTPPTLRPEQQTAAHHVSAAIESNTFKPFVLDGVMGSGKTEVYFDSVARILEKDTYSQVLVLVPEISLTPQLLKRFEKRFGFEPTAWHANISEKSRNRAWWQVYEGRSRVVVGARSALFLPYKKLGLVIVDEEHDSSYKQEEVFRYHGRDMAVSLAHHWKAPVVLCSATPSSETYQNGKNTKYDWLHLPTRHGGAKMPDIHIVDMKKHKPKVPDEWISIPIRNAIEQRLNKEEQSLVFLNRRGMAPLLICGGCGHRVGCPSCDATLTVHHSYLICHHCGFHEKIPSECPECGAEKLRSFGPGTRKLKKELENLFPTARIAVADSDAIQGEKQMGELVEEMEHGDIDILIGTQMVAKGHHFPKLTLSAIIDGDMGLASGELRAAERTFQVLMQVAGRAGRGSLAGEVMIQTHDPDHALFTHLKTMDRDGFMHMELTHRKAWGDPPFGRQIALILSGKDEKQVAHAAQILRKNFPEHADTQILGPAAAPLAKLRDKYRYRLLVKGTGHLHKTVTSWLSATPIPKSVRVIVDVDPLSFY